MTDSPTPKPVAPLLPANETERLAALHRYRILDTPAEAAFDRITRLAARLFGMPIALISLVDESRAWFKSCIGFDAREVPRDNTLCSFAVLTDTPLIVPDARQDDRFACNPFVQGEPGVRFYAGAPLLSQDGFNLGTLCLLDSQPRAPLTPEQQATLVDLAAMVVDELELRLAAHQIAQVDTALIEITQGVATVTGEAYFDALVRHFAKVLDVDYAYIGLIGGDDPKILRTIATCAHGQIVENLEYLLQETPCWEVIQQGKICCYPRNVQVQFPNAPLLKPLSIESYVAIPFFDSSGTTLGLLGVMDGKPLENVQLAESLLTIFANRIATELERQQTEATLRESEEKYRSLFESIDEGFCIVEVLFEADGTATDHRILQANAAFGRHTGILDPKGKTASELAPGIEQYWNDLYAQVIQTGETARLENYSDALDRWFNVLVWRVGDASTSQVAIVFTDITQRKQAETVLRASHDTFRYLVETSPFGVYVIDADFRLAQVSAGAQKVFESIHPLIGRDFAEVLRLIWTEPFASEAIARFRHTLETGEPYHSPSTIERRQDIGEIESYDWKLERLILPDGRLGVVCHFYDLSERQHYEAALRESEERFRNMADNAPVMIWVTDPTGACTYLSQSWYDFTGQTEETGLGFGWLSRVHPDDCEFAEQLFLSANQRQEAFTLEYRLQDRHGVYIWAIDAASPWFGEEGQFKGYIGSVLDISDRKRVEDERQQAEAALRESENRLRLALESTELGTWDFNPITGTLQWDDQCKAMFGLSLEAEINYDVFLAGLHPEDRERTDQVVRFALNSESNGEYEIEYRTVGLEDRVERWIAAKGKAFFSPEGIANRFIGTVLNRTEQKRAEVEREQLLQREQAAREEAERANRLKDEFLAVLSHELRSPLNPILGWTRLLQKGNLDSARQAAALETIERNATLQSQLIEDLLDISRIMQGKLSLTPAPVSLTFVISAAVETVRLAAEAKQIQIILNLDLTLPPISGDANRLQQVVWNLLTNAVKFTPSGGRVTVDLKPVGQMARICITDTGKGIAPQFLPHVFEYFRQEDGSTTRRFGGLGLGLAIVRQIVEMHGGTVQAESQGEDQGAMFTVTLPLQKAIRSIDLAPEIDAAEPDSRPLAGLRILVVDDEPDSRNLVAFVVQQAGAGVVSVPSGREALQILQTLQPDVLLSDIGMPEMDGYALMREIQAQNLNLAVKIALTAYAGEIDQEQALACGFQQHLTKPFDPAALVETITHLVDQRSPGDH